MAYKDKEKARAYNTRYRLEHKEHIAILQAKWYAEHKAEIAPRVAQYRAEHREEHKAYSKRWCIERKEEIAAYRIEYRAKHKKEILAANSKYKAMHKEKCAAHQRKSNLKREYGLTIETYNGMIDLQNGKCAICENEPTTTFCVDHDHETGEIRGLLCNSCNKLLGNAHDSKKLLENAIAYLEKRKK